MPLFEFRLTVSFLRVRVCLCGSLGPTRHGLADSLASVARRGPPARRGSAEQLSRARPQHGRFCCSIFYAPFCMSGTVSGDIITLWDFATIINLDKYKNSC